MDLVTWTQLIGFAGQPALARCEIHTFRYRVLHVAARITRGARRTRLRIDALALGSPDRRRVPPNTRRVRLTARATRARPEDPATPHPATSRASAMPSPQAVTRNRQTGHGRRRVPNPVKGGG